MALTLVQEVDLRSLSEQDKKNASELVGSIWHKPAWDSIVYQTSGKYWLTSALAQKCGTEYEMNNVYNWVEEGKYFGKEVVDHTVAVTEATAGELVITYTNTKPQFVVTDIVDLGHEHPTVTGINIQGRVIEVGVTSSKHWIKVKLFDADTVGEIGPDDFVTAGHEIALITNAQGECFTLPKGRTHQPDKKDNCFHKISDSFQICDEATRKKLYFRKSGSSGEGYGWLDYEAIIAKEEHNRKVDNTILFSQRGLQYDDDGMEVYMTEGIVTKVAKESLVFGFSGTLLETDIQSILTTHATFAKVSKWDWFVGHELHLAIQKALKDYAVNGSFNYGSWSPKKMQSFGINVTQYQIGNLSMNLFNYDAFSDRDFLPQNTAGVDYTNMGLVLNTQGDACKVMYQLRAQGQPLKGWYDELAGVTMAGNHKPVTRQACLERAWTTSVGTKLKGMNNHALIVKE